MIKSTLHPTAKTKKFYFTKKKKRKENTENRSLSLVTARPPSVLSWFSPNSHIQNLRTRGLFVRDTKVLIYFGGMLFR
ncbi:hypothetical protein Pfo_023729 [Paulownia fortunei]|nr:hypothetical protein Pfo_023729 [Paulownia fortunei]